MPQDKYPLISTCIMCLLTKFQNEEKNLNPFNDGKENMINNLQVLKMKQS
jgi:hypothetical protein